MTETKSGFLSWNCHWIPLDENLLCPAPPQNFCQISQGSPFSRGKGWASLIWTDRCTGARRGAWRLSERGRADTRFVLAFIQFCQWRMIQLFLQLIQLPFFISISYNRFSILHCQQIQHNTEKKNWVKMTKMAMAVWTEILYLLASLTMNEHDPHSHSMLGSRM